MEWYGPVVDWISAHTFEILFVAGFIILKSIWGYATRAIVKNKGYRSDWFWWGFFFGLIALIVAIAKPNIVNTPEYLQWQGTQTNDLQTGLSDIDRLREYRILADEGAITEEVFDQKLRQILQIDAKTPQ